MRRRPERMAFSRCSSSSIIRSPVELPAKILTPQTPRPSSSSGKGRDVGLGAADVEAHVAPGDGFDVVLLPGQAFGVGDRRAGVGHVEHRRQAAEDCAPCAGGDGFDRLVAGIAQVDVRVDQAGQDVQAAGVDRLVGGGIRADTQRGDAAVADADIGVLRAPRQDAGAVADQQVVMRRHFWSSRCLRRSYHCMAASVTARVQDAAGRSGRYAGNVKPG